MDYISIFEGEYCLDENKNPRSGYHILRGFTFTLKVSINRLGLILLIVEHTLQTLP